MNLFVFVTVLLLLTVQGICLSLYPASTMQRNVGRALVVLCAIQIYILIAWLLKRRGGDSSERK